MQLREKDLTWHVAGEEVVVLDLEGSVYLKLNGSGRLLWEKLTEPCEQSDLIETLVNAYGIDERRAETDVESFLTDIRQRGLLEE